ncbi:MAG: thiamine diphosphokinase [Cyclonatronaceae bacterium]
MRVLILANGLEPSAELLGSLRSRCDRFLAADGGGNVALRLGFEPDAVIGDMDSFRQPHNFAGEVLRDPDQESNDLEKALQHARSLEAGRVDVLGATGKRLDHALKNLSVMQQFSPFFDHLLFFDDLLCSRILPRLFTISLPVGHLVSLFPLSGRVDGIVTEGLKYPLCDEPLENGRRDGSSNETTEEMIRIRHRSGALLFMTTLTDALLQ